MAEQRRIRFLYRQAQAVSWAGVGRWRIAWRRWTERDVLAPLVEYGLVLEESEERKVVWVNEADVLPREEDRR